MGYDRNAWRPRDYAGIDGLKTELTRFQRAHESGELYTTGNWSAGQILEHCGKLMRFSFDGFEARAPWYIRLVGVCVFKPLLGRSHMRPGIKLPASAASLLPRTQVPFDEGMAEIRAQIDRVDHGQKMTKPSPALGRMRHEQWVLLHLDHCRMHFGFIQCGE